MFGWADQLRTLREDVRVVMERDPSVRTAREALLHPAMPALWVHRVAAPLHRRGHPMLAKLLANLARTVTGVEIHPGASVGRRVFIDHGAGVVIGETAVIGDDVTIFHQVTLGAVGWWTDNQRSAGQRRHPVVGDRVIIGCNASVLGPVIIGDDAIVGAQALVTADVPAGGRVYATAATRPAANARHSSARQISPPRSRSRREQRKSGVNDHAHRDSGKQPVRLGIRRAASGQAARTARHVLHPRPAALSGRTARRRVLREANVDAIVCCETNDLDALMTQVRSVGAGRPFDAFLTMGEYDVVLAARAGRLLGLPGPDPEAVAVARNKARMRERCAAADVPMPAFGEVVGSADGVEVAARIGLPCVVKPVDETSSVDVVRCSTLRQVREHVVHILRKHVNTRGQLRVPTVLVEECLHGHEVSVEILAEGDRFHVLGVTDKSVAGQGHFVEIGHVFPSLLPADVVTGCADVAVRALRASGFDLGLAHVEIKITADGPKLVEINPRPAGGNIVELVDRALGLSCLDLVLAQYLGEPVVQRLQTEPRAGVAILYLSAAPGRVDSVTGVDIARGMPGVVRISVKAAPGDHVSQLRRNADRQGYVMTVGSDSYTAVRRAEAAAHEIVISTDAVPPVRRIADDLSDLIGRTPTVRIPVPDAARGAQLVAKLEMGNPLSSVKDRAALFMIRGAERRGDLTPGVGTIVEATSGNTGIALAGLAAARGYRCIVVLPDTATVERVELLRALGAEVVHTPGQLGYPGAIARAEQIHHHTPHSWFPRQHENPDNVRAHYETTGPELWADLDGRIDALVCGVGTGGTLTGIARYLKERNPRVHVVAVEPQRSPVLSAGIGGLHAIPGLNGGFLAPTTDLDCIDEVMTVTDEEAVAAGAVVGRQYRTVRGHLLGRGGVGRRPVRPPILVGGHGDRHAPAGHRGAVPEHVAPRPTHRECSHLLPLTAAVPAR